MKKVSDTNGFSRRFFRRQKKTRNAGPDDWLFRWRPSDLRSHPSHRRLCLTIFQGQPGHRLASQTSQVRLIIIMDSDVGNHTGPNRAVAWRVKPTRIWPSGTLVTVTVSDDRDSLTSPNRTGQLPGKAGMRSFRVYSVRPVKYKACRLDMKNRACGLCMKNKACGL
jgi:hypothetical protein